MIIIITTPTCLDLAFGVAPVISDRIVVIASLASLTRTIAATVGANIDPIPKYAGKAAFNHTARRAAVSRSGVAIITLLNALPATVATRGMCVHVCTDIAPTTPAST
jgi:hypothetical protein